jgi:copper resistance protein C
MRSVCLGITLAAVLVAAVATAVGAHAVLVGSSPKDKATIKAAPKQVVLNFNATIDKKVTKVTLLDAKGHKVALPTPKDGYTAGPPASLIVPMPALKPGAYRLEYEVMATDGHITPGLVRFTIAGGKSP